MHVERDVVIVEPVIEGGARNRRLPYVVVARHPRGHVAAVRPARDRDAALIYLIATFDRRDTGHDVAAGSRARIAVNPVLVTVAQIRAAAIIRIEHEIAVRGEELV